MLITIHNTEEPFATLSVDKVTLPEEVFVEAANMVQGLKLSVKSGEKQRVYPLDKKTNISAMLQDGEVMLALALYDGTELVRKWQVDSIICKQAENNADAIPQIEELKKQIEVLKNALKELYKMVKGE